LFLTPGSLLPGVFKKVIIIIIIQKLRSYETVKGISCKKNMKNYVGCIVNGLMKKIL